MRRFFIASTFMFLTQLYAMACGGTYPTYNYYMFSVLDYEYNPVNTNTDKFWADYSNGEVTEFDAEALLNIARQRGDRETQNYIALLQDYLEACGSNDSPWDYPSKEVIDERQAMLKKILSATKLYKGTKFKEHYALLQMRVNRALKRHDDNIAFWNNTGSKFADSAFRNRMEGIYAGSLLRTGKRSEACEIYAQLGDEESIKWVSRHYCNLAGILYFYSKDPNSPMLPYLVQRFVNNAQETLDIIADGGNPNDPDWFEMVQALPTGKSDVMDFIKFADEAAANPQVKTPCLYLSAAGFLHYLHGNQEKAEEYLSRAQTADGTEIQYDNLRALRLLVSTRSKHNTKDYEKYILQELRWLNQKMQESSMVASENDYYGESENHYTHVYYRVVFHGLLPYYDKLGQNFTSVIMLSKMGQDPEDAMPYYCMGSHYVQRLDSMTADEAIAYYALLRRGGDTELQRYFIDNVKPDANYFNDIIGTKMLREERWKEAIKYMEKVPLAYLNDKAAATYAKYNDYNKPRWMGKQRIPKDADWENPGLTSNKKIDFCKDVMALQKSYKKASGEEKCLLAYRLATLYYQASYLGDCWFLTQYGQTANEDNAPYSHDFIGEALKYLEVAKTSSNNSLRTEALYACAYIPRDSWFKTDYDKETYDYYFELQPQSRQFKALSELSAIASQGAPTYITRCDVLRLFRQETASGTGGRRDVEKNKYFRPW